MQKKLTTLLIVLTLLFCVSTFTFGDLFNQNHKLLQIQTEYFTIIYPEVSQTTAQILGTMADEVYSEVAELLDVPMDLHIPVVITPDSQELNGYFSMYPSARIVLYEAPILPNSGFALYNDTLRKLFLHELTHAVSLSIRSPFWQFLATVIGDVISPASITAPPNLIEGVTVSFESLDGFGRAQDTEYLSIIQQDILEGRFMTFHETASIRESYPFGAWYIYGGGFSRFLQETYGFEKYAQLWKKLGQGRTFRNFLFIPGAFGETYSKDFDAIWEEFRSWISLKVPVISETIPLTENWDYIRGLTARNDKVYFSGLEGLYQFDLVTRESRRLTAMDSSLNRIDVSPDGSQLLLSVSQIKGEGLPERSVKIFDIQSRRYLDNHLVSGVSEAAFVPQGIAGIRIKGYTTDLVLIKNGTEQVLFSGDRNLVPSFPGYFQDNWILFLLQEEGVHRLARINILTKNIEIMETTEPVEGIRNLFIQRGKVAFAYDNDFTLLKLGFLTPDNLVIQTTPISGGVRFPAIAQISGQPDSSIIYTGAFSRGHRIMEFPKNNPGLELHPIEFRWAPYQPRVLPPQNAIDLPNQTYRPLANILLPQFRLPRLLLNEYAESPTELIRGAGFMTFSSDPTEALFLSTDLAYLWNEQFADFGISYTDTRLPMDISLEINDRLYFMDPDSGIHFRQLSAGLSITDTFRFFPSQRQLGYDLYSGLIFPSSGNNLSSPYSWAFQDPILPLETGIFYQEYFGGILSPYQRRGYKLGLNWIGFLDLQENNQELYSYLRANLNLALPFLGFDSTITGYHTLHRDLGFHPMGTIYYDTRYNDLVLFNRESAYPPYSGYVGFPSPYSIKSDTSLGYRFDTSTSLPGQIYVQQAWIRGGYRNGFLNTVYLDSLYVRTGYTFFWGSIGTFEQIPFKIGIELETTLRNPVKDQVFFRVIFE